MKKFEVGKYYEASNILCNPESYCIMTWQCTKVHKNSATFKLVGYRYTEDGKNIIETDEFYPREANCKIYYNILIGFEYAYNASQRLYLAACNEVKGE